MSNEVNLTANGSSPWFQLPQGKGTVVCSGTFDGATVTVELLSHAGNAIAVEAFTEAFTKESLFRKTTRLRATVSDAGASTDLTFGLQ